MNELITKVLRESQYEQNPYFVNLNSGDLDKEDFVETQIQFYHAVVFFSRPMAALAAKIPLADLRLEVLRNVWEEHGEGDLSIAHGQTFTEFLRRLDNVTPEQVALRGLWPEIRIFNTALVGVATLDDYLVGVAAMGMIERMFADISAWIGQGTIKRGWMSEDGMIHYKLHQKLDIKHSDDFFDILRASYQQSANHRYRIEQGLAFGATLFNDLYTGLWRSRKRRWKLETPMVASLAANGL